MASNFEIGVKFGAEGIPQVAKSITDLNNQLQRFRQGLNTAVGVDSIARLNKAIETTQQRIKALQSFKGITPNFASSVNNAATTLNSQFTPAVGRANLALLNVGRIAQDAPFGFIGIANNIEPLIQSFQALRKESGSTGGVLSALGKSLIGPGGILLGVSALTFVMAGGVDSIKKFFASFSDANKNITDAKKFIAEIKSVSDIRLEASGSVAGEIAEVQALADVVRDETAAKNERTAAIERLKQINKSYFGDLSLEKSSLDSLTKAQEEYTQALIQQAVVKGISDEITKVSTELRKQEKELARLEGSYKRVGGAAAGTNLAAQLPDVKNFSGDLRQVNAILKAGDAQKAFLQQRDIVEQLRTEFASLNGEISVAVQNSLKLKPLDVSTDKAGVDQLAKRLAALEKIRDVQEELTKQEVLVTLAAAEIKGLTPEQVQQLTGEKAIAESFKRVDDLVNTSRQIYDLKVKITLRDAAKNGLSKTEVEDLIKSYRKQLEDAFTLQAETREATIRVKPSVTFERADTTPEEIKSEVAKATGLDKTIPIITNFQVNAKLLGFDTAVIIAGIQTAMEDFAAQVRSIIKNFKEQAFASLGEGIANVFSGEGLKGLVSPFLNVLADTLGQLGKASITYGLKLLALKKTFETTRNFFKANPALLIGAGIAAVAAAALIRKQFQNDSLPKFANGGIASGPLSGYPVELHGRELIVPLDKLNGQPGLPSTRDIGGNIRVFGMLRGEDIFFSGQKVQRRKKRI